MAGGGPLRSLNPMATGLSLLQLIERLFADPDAAAAFADAPDSYLAEHGLGELSGADIHDALSLGFDSVPVSVAARLAVPDEVGDGSAGNVLGGLLLDSAPAGLEFDDGPAAGDLDFGLGDLELDLGGTVGAAAEDVDDELSDIDVDGDVSLDGPAGPAFGGGAGSDVDGGDPLSDIDDPSLQEDDTFDDGEDLM